HFGILFVRGPACPDFGPAFGTTETQLGLWLARHPDERPAYVLYDTVGLLDSHYPTLWYPETNGYNWYRPIDSAAAIHLCAGVYRRSPDHALAPAALVLLAAIAAVVLYRSAYDASDLDVVPDSVEYALVAARLASEGSLGISLEGRLLPSRYSPWFPIVLAPAYVLLGDDPGNAIYV